MASRRKTTVAKQIERGRLTIEGTLNNPDVQEAVAPFGYPKARMDEGWALLETVLAKRTLAEGKRTTKKAKTLSTREATDTVIAAFTPLVKIARAVLPADSVAIGALGLDRGRIPRSRAALLDFGRRFLKALDADTSLAATLGGYGVTPAKRSAAQSALTALEQAQSGQAGAKGEAEDARPAAQDVLDAMNAWVMQYRKIARIALAEHPQLLEKLGMNVP